MKSVSNIPLIVRLAVALMMCTSANALASKNTCNITIDKLYELISEDARTVDDVQPVIDGKIKFEDEFLGCFDNIYRGEKNQSRYFKVNYVVNSLSEWCDSLSMTTIQMMRSSYVKLYADNVRQSVLINECLNLAKKNGSPNEVRQFFMRQYVPLQKVLREISSQMYEYQFWGGTFRPVAMTMSEDDVIYTFGTLLDDIINGAGEDNRAILDSLDVSDVNDTASDKYAAQLANIYTVMKDAASASDEDRLPFPGFETALKDQVKRTAVQTAEFISTLKSLFNGISPAATPEHIDASVNIFYATFINLFKFMAEGEPPSEK